ncbi:enoyl-CoA hydratase [Rummeliibacillus sp. NPDC094406]|uniref:enoyl-CoA hydratase n=1 Tax=Rummeliibacillus sp. NPDC094406 TaxID=3364511 RepID=UPI003811E9B7
MNSKEKVSLTIENQIAILMIQNPPVNILDADVVEELHHKIDIIEQTSTIKVVLITGDGGKAFMAGGDIKSFPEWMGKGVDVAKEKSQWLQHPLNRIEALPYPTICILNGVALGGGCELALACDIRIAEKHATIGLPEIKLGLFPGAGGTQRLARLVGKAKAKEIIFTGEPLSADQALAIGLVNTVVPKWYGLTTGIQLAKKIATHSRQALTYVKQAIDEGYEQNLSDALITEADYFGHVFQTEDIKEGVAAFIEKRKPRFLD